MAVSWSGTLTVVEVDDPERVLLRTRSLREADSVCRKHPERGVVGKVEGVARFLPIANPIFRERFRLDRLA